MRNFRLTIILFSFLISINSFSQNDTLMPSYANVATLVVNYNTYQFEGGDLSYYFCSTCNNDSLPFSIDYNSPGDFGDITFNISSTNDTVFNATIIWMGTGQIHYPNSFSSNTPFNISTTVVEKPLDISYWNMSGQITTDSFFINQADSAWHEIESFKITDMFFKLGFKVGIYLYPPTVGMFNPSVAKWIIFLYTNIETVSIEGFYKKADNSYIFPNPTNNSISINQVLLSEDARYYTIINQLGNTILKGQVTANNSQIDLSSFSSGLYYIELFDSKMTRIKIEKVIKR